MTRPVEEYAAQIARARRTSRRVAVFAAISWGTGWIDVTDMWFAVVLGMLVLVRHQRNLRDAWAAFRS